MQRTHSKEGYRLLVPVAFCSTVLLLLFTVTTHVQAEEAMSDQAIADEIDDELLFDPGVNSSMIDLSVSNGIVTLTGSVNSLLAKERAAKTATTVKGVRSVVNQIEVEPSEYRNDSEISRDVETALLEDPATDSYEIDVTVDDGVATLRGNVQSYQERDLALTVAKGVRGVTGVRDKIDVNYKTDRSDAEIKHEIEQALKWNTYIDDNLIDVEVNEGQVTLSGTVGSAAEKTMANTTAWVAGVGSVDDEDLSVERWARDDALRGNKYVSKQEDEIREAVNDALMTDPRVMSFNIDVDATGSLVTLRGQVDNLKAKRAAGQDAWQTVGVSHVTNRIKVRPDDPPADDKVEEAIRDALLRNPYVERFEITTIVTDGVAHLYGSVDTYFEKQRATDLASRVEGVLDVENHLTVNGDDAYLYDPYVDDSFVEDDLVMGYERRSPYQTDSQIKDSIESELWWSPFVDADQVNVTVDNGVARLTGTVDSWSELRAATENAYEGGATLVDNDLTVDYSS